MSETPETDDQTSAEAEAVEEQTADAPETPEQATGPEDWDIESALGGNPGDDADRADVAKETPDLKAAEADGAETAADEAAKAAEPDGAEDTAEDDPGADDEDEAELLRDLSDSELSRFKPRTRKRLQALIRDRAQIRDQVAELQPVAEKAKPILEQMQKGQLTQENVTELLHIGAVLRSGDFQKFTELMRPYMDAAQQALGEKLPSDLQQLVDNGDTTPEVARELARRRHENAMAQQRLQQANQAQEQARQQQAVQQRAATVRDALNAWEQQVLSSDPDYEQIRSAVHEQVQLEIRANGSPADAEAAQQLAQNALARVKRLAVRPAAKPATPPRPPVGGSNSGSAKAAPRQPETLDDVINMALGG